MENKNNTPVSEENLEEVTGGTGGGIILTGCFFQPNGNIQVFDNKLRAQCRATCLGIELCRCHGKAHCVNKWHDIDEDTKELLPKGTQYRHDQKKPENGYNT